MKLVLLPGNSKRNKEWIEQVARNFGELFEESYISYYKHWTTGEEIIDIEGELKELSHYLAGKKEYIIFAKSIGAAVAIRGIKEGKISPKKCIFLGFPVIWCRDHNIPLDSWIKDYSTPTLFIQNSEDPAMGADDLKNFLNKKRVKNYEFIKTEGNSHDYSDLDSIRNLTKRFVKNEIKLEEKFPLKRVLK